MKKKLPEAVRYFAGLAVTLLSLFGYVSVTAFVDDARQAIAEHPAAVALLTALALLGGAAFSVFLLTGSRWARKRAKVERLERCFAAMPPRRRQMVATALREGEVRAWSLDEDALTLCNMGILGGPPIVPRTGEASFSIQPAVSLEISEHRGEWLGI